MSRLDLALANKEKILVYGDYDVDGTTAVALVYSFLKRFYDNIDYYLPDRYKEGYGISTIGIDYAAANDFKLISSLSPTGFNAQRFSLISISNIGTQDIKKLARR